MVAQPATYVRMQWIQITGHGGAPHHRITHRKQLSVSLSGCTLSVNERLMAPVHVGRRSNSRMQKR